MSEARSLDELRAELDQVDRGLVDLIARRLEIVAGIGAAKADTDTPVRDPGRERAVLDGVEAAARERGVSGELVRRIFREIIGHAVDKQVAELLGTPEQPATVGFQGVENAYSHLAAQKHLAGRGWEATYRGYPSFAEVVDALVSGECDLAVLPVENTTAGSINQVYDLLQASPVHVVGEETWRVDHALAAIGDVPLDSLTRVLSHPQGLEQCAAFLRTLPNAVPVHVFDTAEAMRTVAEQGDPTWAGIGSPEAADAHGLVVLRRGITDQPENYTRFLVLAREPAVVAPRVPSKTSLVLVTSHEEGALLRCLEVLARSQHSMTKLESRPRPGRPFEYLFFLDFEGNVAEPRTQQVVEELRRTARSVKLLGSYPAKVVRADAASAQAADALEALVVSDEA
jgi:chorismate mutase/prephenate dehydratase